MVEYGDYQCPHCQAAQPEVAAVLRHFGRELRFAYRHFPLTTIHALAKPAAETAEFAGAHGLFWDMHSALFAAGHKLSVPTLFALTSQLGLDPVQLRAALQQGTYAVKVEDDFTGGIRSGVNGTPCFFINGRRHDGAFDAITLCAAIDAAKSDAPSPAIRIPIGG
jgi:protein-disulfide isomerase